MSNVGISSTKPPTTPLLRSPNNSSLTTKTPPPPHTSPQDKHQSAPQQKDRDPHEHPEPASPIPESEAPSPAAPPPAPQPLPSPPGTLPPKPSLSMSFDAPLPPYNASDPTATFLNTSCLDLLMIELVPMAYRVVNDVDGLAAEAESRSDGPTRREEGSVSVRGGTPGGGGGSEKRDGGMGVGGSVSANGGTGTGIGAGMGKNGSVAGRMEEEEERDAVFFRLEMLGYRVGQGLVERFSRDRPRFTDTLDVIKFLCKDLWMLVFRKQIDNLKTNHRGVYVLTDNSFRPFARMSTEAGGQAVVRAQPFLWFPCGIIRGALASMGINATVQAETNDLPGATFQIKSLSPKS